MCGAVWPILDSCQAPLGRVMNLTTKRLWWEDPCVISPHPMQSSQLCLLLEPQGVSAVFLSENCSSEGTKSRFVQYLIFSQCSYKRRHMLHILWRTTSKQWIFENLVNLTWRCYGAHSSDDAIFFKRRLDVRVVCVKSSLIDDGNVILQSIVWNPSPEYPSLIYSKIK